MKLTKFISKLTDLQASLILITFQAAIFGGITGIYLIIF